MKSWKQRMLAVILTVCLPAGIAVPIFAVDTGPEATTVPEAIETISGHWAASELTNWVERGWLAGNEQGNLLPDSPVTRAEFMAFMNRMQGYGSFSERVSDYSDVSETSWYYNDVAAALAAGYIEGADGKMRPDDPISRNEAVSIVARAKEQGSIAVDGTVLSQITDIDQVPEWAQSSLAEAVSEGLIAGYEGNAFGGGRNITRAEAVVILNRLDAGIRVYGFSGTYGGASESAMPQASEVTVLAAGVTVKNIQVFGDVTVGAAVDSGSAFLENLTADGNLYIQGGNSVQLSGVTVKGSLVAEKRDVNLVISQSDIPSVQLHAAARIEGNAGSGVKSIEIMNTVTGSVVLQGNSETVTNHAAGVTINVTGSIGKLILNKAAVVTGTGTIAAAEVAEDAGSGTSFETAPETLTGMSIEDTTAEPQTTGSSSSRRRGSTDPGTGSSSGPLTRAEAATLIQQTFRLVDIVPQDVDINGNSLEDVSKVRAYSGTLGVISDEFTVSAAKDAIGHQAQYAVESVINTEIMPITAEEKGKQLFLPDEEISGTDFAAAVARALYGPEQPIEHLETAVKDGFIPLSILSDEPIQKDDAEKLIKEIEASVQIITVFVTADIHGHLVPYETVADNHPVGSLAKMSKIINDHRQKYPDTSLLLDGGDSPYNTNISNLFEGRSTVDMMNQMGYDATVLGNHDFDMSLDNLAGLSQRAKYLFLGANTLMKDTGKLPEWLEASFIKEVEGVKIGIIGLTDDRSKETTHYANTVDIDFAPDIETGKELIPMLAEESDIVICLSHLHGKNRTLLEEVDEIDISIGGGQDLLGQPAYINGSWLINPGKHAESLNQLNLIVKDGKLMGMIQNQILLSANLPEDEEVAAIAAYYESQMGEVMKTVVGHTTVDLDGERERVRNEETNLGNLIADALREVYETDIAFMNGGGIRASIPAGDITLEQVYAVLPFDNLIVEIEVSGQEIWDALENSSSVAGNNDGRFMQVSGLSFVYDISKPAHQRLVSVTMADGHPIDSEGRYTLVCNDFICGGGDGYTMLNVLNEDAVMSETGILLYSTKLYQRDAFHEYLLSKESVSAQLEDRITQIGADASVPEELEVDEDAA